jgi:hypothetical protein
MPEHKLIVDPEVHEPKGASTAALNTVYVSDGAGSGSWQASINSDAPLDDIPYIRLNNSWQPVAVNPVDSYWRADTAGILAPPVGGDIIWNNATQSLATHLFISSDNTLGVDKRPELLNYTQDYDTLSLYEAGDPNTFQRWKITNIVDGTSYVDYTVELVASNGGNISDNTEIICTFQANLIDTELDNFLTGLATAAANEVFIADGAASGAWGSVSLEGDALLSTGEDTGRILVADGSNGVGWQELVWKDILGGLTTKVTGPTAPTSTPYRGGNIDQFAFSAGDEAMIEFHLPHDYAPGTDIYLHFHWSHNGTAVSGNMTWGYDVSYAKGHDQAIFPAEVAGTVTYATVDIATTPQYQHMITELQLSATTPTGTQIDTDDLEVDGVVLARVYASAIPTITGGAPNEPFLHFVDVHYQASYIGTKNKAPNFYS